MSQAVWATINPDTTSGTMLAAILTDFKDALMTGLAGTSRPSQLQPGGMWIDTTNQSAPTYTWAFKIWTGTVDIEVFRLNVQNGFGGSLTSKALFEVKQVSADTVGAYMQLIKNRVADNGGLLSGDTIGEIRFVGRTASGTDPVVGYIKWIATDDFDASNAGGTLSFFSTPDASSTISEFMKMIGGLVEFPMPLVYTAETLVSQNVATAATIAQLNGDYAIVEFTGSTVTDVQGINSGDDSREITLHNRSTALVTLKHQNGTAAAADRMKLPSSADFVLAPEASVTLYYCTTDSRWKIKSSVSNVISRVRETISGLINTWTAPTDVSNIVIYARRARYPSAISTFLDRFGNAYSWGANSSSQLGVGDTTDRSSPVAVAGGLKFKRLSQRSGTTQLGILADGRMYGWGSEFKGEMGDGAPTTISATPIAVLGGLKWAAVAGDSNVTLGITNTKKLYGWGDNGGGQLGLGDVVARSSPVAVVGGLQFEQIRVNNGSVMGITPTGALYGWGINASFMGINPPTGNTSSPIAVAGGLVFKKFFMRQAGLGGPYQYGLTPAGAMYAWGENGHGQLGVGDTTDRVSSPIAVIGGLTFKDFASARDNIVAITTGGLLYAWGQNARGDLGVGDTTSRSSPVAVLGGLTNVAKVYSAGTQTYFALLQDGSLYAWGSNSQGVLGVGDITHRSSPVAVLGGLKFSDIVVSANGLTVFGFATDGTMYAWGQGPSGDHGVGDVTSRSSPVAVVGPHGFDPVLTDQVTAKQVTAGASYDVRLSPVGASYFGTTFIGSELDEIVVEYEKRGT